MLEDKARSGMPNVYEDAELEVFLEEDSYQTQEEFAVSLGVSQQAILRRLIPLGMIPIQENCVSYESKPRNVESRLCKYKMLLLGRVFC